MRRQLQNLRLWTVTVLVNSMIMSVYLWHITVMIVLIVVLFLAGGFGLGIEPVTLNWWLSRPLWMIVLLALLLPLSLLVSPLERLSRGSERPSLSPTRQVVGAAMICLGISLLALFGYGGGLLFWLDILPFAQVVAGAIVSGMLAGFK